MPLAFQKEKEGAGAGKCLGTKKPWFQNAFPRLVAVNLNLPWPFVWLDCAIREESRHGQRREDSVVSYAEMCFVVKCVLYIYTGERGQQWTMEPQ